MPGGAPLLVYVGAILVACVLITRPSTAAPRSPAVDATGRAMRAVAAAAAVGAAAAGRAPSRSPPPATPCAGPCCEMELWRPALAWQFRHWRRRSVTLADVNATLRGALDFRGWEQKHVTWGLPAFVFTVLNGTVWTWKNPDGYAHPGRADLIARLIADAATADPASPAWRATQFLVDATDLPNEALALPVRAPAFAHSCFEAGADVCAPDHTHELWMENGADDEGNTPWDELAARIAAAGDARPYASRITKLFFRGDTSHPDRAAVHRAVAASRRPELYDVLNVPFHSSVPRVSLADASRWAVQLSVPGNGYQARLKYALATGSPTIVMVGGGERAVGGGTAKVVALPHRCHVHAACTGSCHVPAVPDARDSYALALATW